MTIDLSLPWQVIQGDCLDVMRGLPDGCVDAVVTDPPYGIGYVHSGGGGPVSNAKKSPFRRNHSVKIHGDDVPFDPIPFIDLPRQQWPKVLLWGADHFRKRLPEDGTFLAWDKSCGYGPADSFADCEFAWTTENVKRNVARVMWKGVVGVKDGENGGKRDHPTQKPLTLMRWCLTVLALEPDSLILDPFCGSGSTGVAAVQLGHRFLGIEREPAYCDIARRRIADAAAQGNLFGGAA